MQQDPPPFVWAVPDEKNILNCECLTIEILQHINEVYVGHYIVVCDSGTDAAASSPRSHSEVHQTVHIPGESITG